MPIPAGLHVVERPSADPRGATVVIVHGAMDRSSSFGRVVRHLPDIGVVRYDRRGYAKSSALGIGTLAQHVADLVEVIGDRPVTVFGHSVGAVIALVAAARHGAQVRSVLAFEPPTPWATWWPPGQHRDGAEVDPADEAEAFMIRAIGERFWNRLPARTRADRRAEGSALLADIASVSGPMPFEPASITCPVVVAYGDETAPRHVRAARELSAALGSAELTVVAGAGHGAHLTHPTATAHLVEQAVAAGASAPDERR